MLARLVVLIAALSFAACASPRFAVQVQRYTKLGIHHDVEAAQKAQALPWDAVYDIPILKDGLPQGFDSEQGRIVVSPELSDRYEVLGVVISKRRFSNGHALRLSYFWYVDFHEKHGSFRDGYCKAQMPLRLLTLGLWVLVSPFNFPCVASYPKNLEDNMEIHTRELGRAAAILGGNMAILKSVTNLKTGGITDISRRTYERWTEWGVQVSAYIVRDRERPLLPLP